MTYWQIEAWRRYQHYTDRQPPWVKFHVKFLDDADLADLRRDTRLVAALLLLVAARTENRIPDNARIVAGWMNLPTRTVNVALKELEKIGYVSLRNETEAEARMAQTGQMSLERASDPLAERASTHARPRARGEAEAEKELRTGNAKRTEGPADAMPGSTNGQSETHDIITNRLVANACRDHPQAVGVLQAACANHTEHTLARALESLLGRKPRPTNPPGYVINTIRAIAAENGHAPSAHIDRPPADF